MTALGKLGSWVIVQPGHPVKVSPKQIALTVSAERDRMAAGRVGRERERSGCSQKGQKERQIRASE